MALGDKLPVIMGKEKAVPSGVATLGEDGKLAKAQRPTTDATPAQGSANPVQSGGVYTALAERADLTLSNLSDRQKALANIGGRPRKNLLDNWYFVGGGSQQGGGQFPINQRGQTSYTASGYTADRWAILAAQTLTLVNSGLELESSGGMFVAQKLENPTQYAGKELTVSVLVVSTNTQVGCRLRNQNGHLGNVYATTPGLYSLTVTVPDDTTALQAEFFNNQAGTSIFAAMKLEFGAQQTLAYQDEDGNWQLFETPDYGEELAKCQRYQIVYPGQGTLIPLSGYNANSLWGCIFLPEEMRITPSIGGGTIGICGVGENISVPVSGFSISLYLLGNILIIRADKTAHGLTAYTATMQLNNLILDANL